MNDESDKELYYSVKSAVKYITASMTVYLVHIILVSIATIGMAFSVIDRIISSILNDRAAVEIFHRLLRTRSVEALGDEELDYLARLIIDALVDGKDVVAQYTIAIGLLTSFIIFSLVLVYYAYRSISNAISPWQLSMARRLTLFGVVVLAGLIIPWTLYDGTRLLLTPSTEFREELEAVRDEIVTSMITGQGDDAFKMAVMSDGAVYLLRNMLWILVFIVFFILLYSIHKHSVLVKLKSPVIIYLAGLFLFNIQFVISSIILLLAAFGFIIIGLILYYRNGKHLTKSFSPKTIELSEERNEH